MIKRVIITTTAIVLLLLSGFYLVGLMSDSEVSDGTEELESISVSYSESDLLSRFVLRFAHREGLFEKNGLNVDIISSENSIHELLLTRQTDVIIGPTTLFNFHFLPNVEMRWIGNVAGHYNGFLVSRYEEVNIGNVSKVGVGRSESIDNFRMTMILRSMGLDPEEMEMVTDLGDSSKEELMRLGEIDIAIIERVDVAQRMEDFGFHLWDMAELRDGINYSAPHIITLDETIDGKSSEMQRFVTAMIEAVELAMVDERAAMRVMMDEMMIDRELAEILYRQYGLAFADRDYVPSLEKLEPVIPFVLDLDRSFRVNKDPESLLSPEFAERAIDLLGIER